MRSSQILSVACVVAVASVGFAQGGGTGPDVIVGDFPDVISYGASNGISAYAFGTSSCNIGTQNLAWLQNTNQHPVIGQNLYRVKDGRFQQIGVSWLKHGFYALSQTLCGSCPNGDPTGNSLAVQCSDPYVASLNGAQSSLGPRSEVNPSTGYFPYPFGTSASFPTPTGVLARRLQAANADVDPAQNPGARYFVEGQYVHPQDAFFGNQNNNASYREVNFTPSSNTFIAAFAAAVQQQKPAILAWRDIDPKVQITNVDVPGDGRLILATKSWSLGNGTFQYVWALHNLNSDRAVQAFNVQLSPGVTVSNTAFHDVNYHSGEVYSTTDWTPSVSGTTLSWATQTYSQNVNANAIRWGTTYTFECIANKQMGGITINLFKPGTPAQMNVAPQCPPAPVLPATPPPQYTLTNNAPFTQATLTAAASNGPTGDDAQLTANIGFTFPFFGFSYTQMVISTNGYLTIPGQNGTVSSNASIPSSGLPNGIIAGGWDDYNVTGAGNIKYQTLGTAPNRVFVVAYNNVAIYSIPTQTTTFQIMLHEDGHITNSIIGGNYNGNSATRGIEAPNGTEGVLASFNLASSMVGGTTHTYATTIIPPDAALSVFGTLDLSGPTKISIVTPTPGLSVFMVAGGSNGPTLLPTGRLLAIGITADLIWVLDPTGILSGTPPNPSLVTSAPCNDYTLVMGGIAPLGVTATVYCLAAAPDPTAPGGTRFTNGIAIVLN